jgi:uncharacterized Fe-S radical SAM superfamily protein PflX
MNPGGFDRAKHLEKCRSKLWYDTEEHAKQAAASLEPRHWMRFYPYRCVFCQLWHLTSKQPSKYAHEHLARKEAEYRARAAAEQKGKP